MDRNRTVSLCVLVRGEAPFLARCLASFKEVVHEYCVLFIDAEAADVVVAESFGAKVDHFDWNADFSEARKRCLEMASMNWVVMVDSDEYLHQESIPVINEAFMRHDCDGFLVRILSFSREGTPFYITNIAPRIFRNNGEFYYGGVVHEQLKNKHSAIDFELVEVAIHHTGNLRKIRSKKSKDGLTLIKKLLAEDKTNMINLFYLAQELSYYKNRQKETLELLEMLYEKIDFEEEFAPRLVIFRVLALIREKAFKKALVAIEEGLAHFPLFTDLVYQRGIIERKKGLVVKPIQSFKKCLVMGVPPAKLEFSNAAYGYGPLFNLAQLMQQEMFFEEAYDYYQECWLLDSGNYHLLSPMFDCLVKMGHTRDEVAMQMKRYFNLHNDLNRVSYVNLLLNKSFFAEAYKFLNSTDLWQAENKRQQLLKKALVGMDFASTLDCE